MRPIRIDLEGFMAHRQANSVDLGEADFFSLSGPTGSGKSSLIDAMIFALYGRVPRLGAKAVAPVISSGAERARVLVEFESDDEIFTVVRSVKRTSAGATTDEARLQVGEDVIASGADAVTTAVEQTLSLGFDDFTRTVVLPQGDFAEFLQATPGERQSLLRKLLDFDFSEVRALAKTRAAVAEDRKGEAEGRLDSLDVPSAEMLLETKQRSGRLEELAASVVEREKALTDLDNSAKGAQTEMEQISNAIERLSSINPPGDIDELELKVTESRGAVETADERHSAERAALKEAETTREQLPSRDSIRGLKERYQELDETRRRLEALDVKKKGDDRETATEVAASANAELAETRRQIGAMTATHAAHALREHLTVGEDCPVCSQVVTVVPDAGSFEGLGELEEKEAELASRVATLQANLDRSRESAAAAEASQVELAARQGDLEQKLESSPSADSLEEILAEVEVARHLVAERQKAVEMAGEIMKQAKRSLEDSSEALASLGRELMAARESIADLEPPLPAADDPLVQWKELLSWCLEARHRSETSLVEARVAAEKSSSILEKTRKSLEGDLDLLGIAAIPPYAVEVNRVLEKTKQELRAYEKAKDDAVELEKAIEAARVETAIANALATHLNVNRFERWLMRGALADLVEGANELLEELSGGGYSLSSEDDGTFEIVDHRNAGETRPVSTLSGGETFLVSLALALSLAETLSGSRGAGLDAIVLDEGFGSLDEESLDTVASVLEELTGRGLMVGVISHVKELAARAPVRYEVRKTPVGSFVELTS